MRLHEIELHDENGVLGALFRDLLPLRLDQPGLQVFAAGSTDMDLNVSTHYPEATVSLSFLVSDLEATASLLEQKGIPVPEAIDTHLGMRALVIRLDGLRLAFHQPTTASPASLLHQLND
jgi:hypothetical protein